MHISLNLSAYKLGISQLNIAEKTSQALAEILKFVE